MPNRWSVAWMPPEIPWELLEEPKVQNTKEQIIIEGNSTMPEQFVNAFIDEERENQNKIPVQLSSNCQYRNADKKCECTEFQSYHFLASLVFIWDSPLAPRVFITTATSVDKKATGVTTALFVPKYKPSASFTFRRQLGELFWSENEQI